MLRIALTGGIATGKSYILARIAARGIPTIDSDTIVHALLARRTPVAVAIAARFGPSVIREDGGVDRRALGRLVFSDPPARLDLERIVHPAVYEQIDAWAAARAAAGAAWVVADIPLLFETHHEADFGMVVVAACDPSLQLQRVMGRDGILENEARARLAAQWPVAEKVKRADCVIQTGGSFEETDRQVDALVDNLERDTENRGRRS